VPVQQAAVERAPLVVLAAGEVADDDVRVKKRIARAGCW